MAKYTVTCLFPAMMLNSVEVEAADPNSACAMGMELTRESENWESSQISGATFVESLRTADGDIDVPFLYAEEIQYGYREMLSRDDMEVLSELHQYVSTNSPTPEQLDDKLYSMVERVAQNKPPEGAPSAQELADAFKEATETAYYLWPEMFDDAEHKVQYETTARKWAALQERIDAAARSKDGEDAPI